MKFVSLKIPGLIEIRPEVLADRRGKFVKTLHAFEFSAAGLSANFAEEYYSVSRKGVLRGLHFQLPPRDHAKLVYCIQGCVIDATVDLRAGSPMYGEHVLLELAEERANVLYIPSGLAHGFYVMSDSATLVYKVTSVHSAAHDSGILWNSAGIPWPDQSPITSVRDRGFVKLADFASPFTYPSIGDGHKST